MHHSLAETQGRCPSAFLGQQCLPRHAPSLLRPRRSGREAVQRTTTCMAGKVRAKIKLAIKAGKANPQPPVGPTLGSKGVNIMAFCKEYNAKTQDKVGETIPVEITVYEDKSFTFVLKTPPASSLLAKAAGIAKGSGTSSAGAKSGEITRDQLREIAEKKMPDLNAVTLENAMKIIEGTARNMGLAIV